MNAMHPTVIEVVLFKTEVGSNSAQIEAAARALTPVLARLDGFIRRELAHDGDQWVDLVHWRDLAAAQAASQAVLTMPECQPFFSLIDPRSVRMLHCVSKLQQQA